MKTSRFTEEQIVKILRGPTIAPVYPKAGQEDTASWYSVSLIVRSDQMLRVVDHLRAIGSTGIVVLPVHYVFGDRSDAFTRLQARLAEEA